MSTTITGKLNKPAREFQAGAYTGFGIRLGKQYYDRETKQKEWTNYEAAVFTDKPQQIDFYRSSLIEGSVVEVMAEAEKIKQFQGDTGLVLSIELIDCKLGMVHTGQQPQQSMQQAPQQQYQQAPQQAPMQQSYQQEPQQAPMQQPQYAPQHQQEPQQAPQQSYGQQNNGYAQS